MNCKFCEKECKNKNSLIQHELRCKLNPNRRSFDNLTNFVKQQGNAWNKGLTSADKRVSKMMESRRKTMKDKRENRVVLNFDEIHDISNKGICSRIMKGKEYLIVYIPDHPFASDSTVYLHRLVMELHLGRYLAKSEHVHHIDGNTLNNEISNLMIMSNSEHSKLHYHHIHNTTPIVLEDIKCPQCHKIFKPTSSKTMYCSSKCKYVASRKFNPTREELEELVWKMPLTKIGELFGVTGKAIAKRCKKLGIEKPKQGYWIKSHTIIK